MATRRSTQDPSVLGFLGNLAGGAAGVVGGLGQLAGQAVTHPGDFFTDVLPQIPGQIADDYSQRYGALMPGGAPAGDVAQQAYDDPVPYLLDALMAGEAGRLGAKGVGSLMDVAGSRGLTPANEVGAITPQGFADYFKSISGPTGVTPRDPYANPGVVEPLAPMPNPAVTGRPEGILPETAARDAVYKFRDVDSMKKAIIQRSVRGEITEAEAAQALDHLDTLLSDPQLSGLNQGVLDEQFQQANTPSRTPGGSGGPVLGEYGQVVLPEYGGGPGAGPTGIQMRNPALVSNTPVFPPMSDLTSMPEFADLSTEQIEAALTQELGRPPTAGEIAEFKQTTPPRQLAPGGPSDLRQASPEYAQRLREQTLDKGPQFSNEAAANAIFNPEVVQSGQRAELANADRFSRAPSTETTPIYPRRGSPQGNLQQEATRLVNMRSRAEQATESLAFPDPGSGRPLADLSEAELSGLIDEAISNRFEAAAGHGELDEALGDAATHAERVLRSRGVVGGGRQGTWGQEFSTKYGDPSRDVFSQATAESPVDPNTLQRLLVDEGGGIQQAPSPMKQAYNDRAYAEDVRRATGPTDTQKVSRRRLRQEATRPEEQIGQREVERPSRPSKRKTVREARSGATSEASATPERTVQVGSKQLSEAQIRKKLAYWDKEGVENAYVGQLREALTQFEGGTGAGAPIPPEMTPRELMLEGQVPAGYSPDDLLQAFAKGDITAEQFWELQRAGGAEAAPEGAMTNTVTESPKRRTTAEGESKTSTTKRKSAKEKGLVDIENLSDSKLLNRLRHRLSRGEDTAFVKALKAEAKKRGLDV